MLQRGDIVRFISRKWPVSHWRVGEVLGPPGEDGRVLVQVRRAGRLESFFIIISPDRCTLVLDEARR